MAPNPGGGRRQQRARKPERNGGRQRAGAAKPVARRWGWAGVETIPRRSGSIWIELEQGAYNAYAGGLLFAPLLARYNFLPTLRRVITIPTHEGYSLEELGLTLFYLDVFGFRSLEDFKRAYPEEFGVLMGRAQSPSLFTLRRFLHKVRKLGKGEALIDEFALTYLKSGLAAWGVMYIDGHFMPYYGLYPISKGETTPGGDCVRPCLELPADPGRQHHPFPGDHDPDVGHCEVPIHENEQHPQRENAGRGKDDEIREPAQRIGKGIQDFTQFRLLVPQAGQVSVQQV